MGEQAERIPATVLTGYLGAGKTTLLNRILSGDHGRRYAVIVNEYGEIGIDAKLVIGSDEELFEMNNGCVCCTVRGDLIRTVRTLLARPDPFDAIVVETTGLADPSPVAQSFFVDPAIRARVALDSIIALVDCHHIRDQIRAAPEASEQIAFADQIILNKMDLAAETERDAIQAQVRALNPWAPIHHAERAGVDLRQLLGLGGFELARAVELVPEFLQEGPAARHADHGHDHLSSSGIGSVSLSTDRPLDSARVSKWLTDLVAIKGRDILRAKGILDVAGEDRRLVFQAVHMLLEGDFQQPWRADETRRSRLVFIGRNLDRSALEADFLACAA